MPTLPLFALVSVGSDTVSYRLDHAPILLVIAGRQKLIVNDERLPRHLCSYYEHGISRAEAHVISSNAVASDCEKICHTTVPLEKNVIAGRHLSSSSSLETSIYSR